MIKSKIFLSEPLLVSLRELPASEKLATGISQMPERAQARRAQRRWKLRSGGHPSGGVQQQAWQVGASASLEDKFDIRSDRAWRGGGAREGETEAGGLRQLVGRTFCCSGDFPQDLVTSSMDIPLPVLRAVLPNQV